MIIASESTRGVLHLQDDGSGIRLHVPHNDKERELSYLTQVPERIVSYFGIKDRGAAKVFGDVLRSSLIVLDDVLTNHGIVHVQGVTAESMPGNEMPTSSESSTRSSPRANSNASAPTSAADTVVEDAISSTASLTGGSSIRVQPAPLAQSAGSGIAPVFAWEEPSQTRANLALEKYRALLDHVIKSAPCDRGSVNHSGEPFVPDEVFGVRTTNPLLHDMKIGAAGELYVRIILPVLRNFFVC